MCSISEHISDPYIRLVAYGGRGGHYTSRSAEFESRDRLLKALRSVAPDFDESTLLAEAERDTPETYIAFTGEMELGDQQLSLLGLQDGRRS